MHSLFTPRHSRALRWVLPIVISVAFSPSAFGQTVPAPGTPAAQIQQQIGSAGLSSTLRQKLLDSGLTAEQVRQRLASLGYDPSTLDPFLSDQPQGQTPPAPTPGTVNALRALGYADLADQAAAAPDERPEPAPPTPEEVAKKLRVFGVDVFSRGSSEFDPVISGALPSSYTLGPGDEIVLVITGDVEFIHTLPVTREGFIVVPQVGEISVNGMTLAGLRQQLQVRLGRVYSGIGVGTTRFDVSVNKTRSNQIFITGDVTRPGSYTASPLASVLNVLYQAGGPTGNGSFRNIQIMRSGQLQRRVDLYQYLLSGNNLSDLHLETGDVVFVPVHGTHVSITGQVARPSIYELKDGETLADLLGFAGGLNAPAHTRHARLIRVVPPAERRDPGIDRVAIDVDLDRALRDPAAAPVLRPGDAVEVLAVNAELRHVVSLGGSVWRDGAYEFQPGMHAWDLLQKGDGLKPDAYTGQAQITRRNRADGSLTTISFSLEKGPDGKPVENPELRDDDVLTVFSKADSPEDLPVAVDGAVRNPFKSSFEKGMTLHDAIIRAGGLRSDADPVVEISRLATADERARGEVSQIVHMQLDSSYFVSDEAAAYYAGHPDSLLHVHTKGAGNDFMLKPYDRVFIRTVPNYMTPTVVKVAGEVKYPGYYTLRRKDERLAELIERAGGLTNTAYAEGFKFVRKHQLVDVDLPKAMQDSRNSNNMLLLAGDSMFVPEFNAIVTVQGAVGSPAAVLYKKGADLSYYISSAGGYARNADKSRVHVRYANGRGETKHRTAIFFASEPAPGPGSTVTVPFVLREDRFDTRGLVRDLASIMAALGTVALAISRL